MIHASHDPIKLALNDSEELHPLMNDMIHIATQKECEIVASIGATMPLSPLKSDKPAIDIWDHSKFKRQDNELFRVLQRVAKFWLSLCPGYRDLDTMLLLLSRTRVLDLLLQITQPISPQSDHCQDTIQNLSSHLENGLKELFRVISKYINNSKKTAENCIIAVGDPNNDSNTAIHSNSELVVNSARNWLFQDARYNSERQPLQAWLITGEEIEIPGSPGCFSVLKDTGQVVVKGVIDMLSDSRTCGEILQLRNGKRFEIMIDTEFRQGCSAAHFANASVRATLLGQILSIAGGEHFKSFKLIDFRQLDPGSNDPDRLPDLRKTLDMFKERRVSVVNTFDERDRRILPEEIFE